MSKNEIASFSIPDRNESYKVYGNCDLQTTVASNGQLHIYPEFHDLTAEKIVGKQYIPCKPSAVSFSGHQLNELDMIGTVIAAAIRMDNTYVLDYVSPEIKGLISWYQSESETLIINNMIFPKEILHTDMFQQYELHLVTDRYTYYYTDDGAVLMLNTSTRGLVSDNHFAEDGFWTSLDQIEEGKEALLWKNETEEGISIMKDNIIERLKRQLPEGAKIKYFMKKESRSSGKLIASDIPCGTPGSVIQVYDDGRILVNWEDKHKGFIHYGIDLFELA